MEPQSMREPNLPVAQAQSNGPTPPRMTLATLWRPARLTMRALALGLLLGATVATPTAVAGINQQSSSPGAGTQTGSGGSQIAPARDPDTGVGDYRYESDRTALRCRTPAGGPAACARDVPEVSATFRRHSSRTDSNVPGDQPLMVKRSIEGVYCGNGVCDGNENQGSCAADCGGTNPSGIGAEIGNGDCRSTRYLKRYAVEGGKPGKFCQLSASTGEGEFGSSKTFTDRTSFAAVAQACFNGTNAKSSLRLVCVNGSWMEAEFECYC